MVRRQLRHRLLHLLPQMPLPVQVVRAVRVVLPLQGPMVRVPVLLDGLEQDQRVPRPVPQLVLRQVPRDRVHPRRELPGLVEPLQVSVHPHQRLLHDVLRPRSVPDHPVHEIQQPDVIPVRQHRERTLLTRQRRRRQLAVPHLPQHRRTIPSRLLAPHHVEHRDPQSRVPRPCPPRAVTSHSGHTPCPGAGIAYPQSQQRVTSCASPAPSAGYVL